MLDGLDLRGPEAVLFERRHVSQAGEEILVLP